MVDASHPETVPVVIAGGGPVGLSMAALLAEYGIATLTLEADAGYCEGSRAICMSRRSAEILGWFGAHQPLVAKGLGWTAGRSYFRDQEVLHFDMPHDPNQRFDPMINIQQFYVEEFAHQAMQRHGNLARLSWSSRVTGLVQDADGALVTYEKDGMTHQVRCQWLVAADGGRSAVRDLLGLTLKGMQYEGRYVIVDIEQESSRPTERLAWFDPPSNPGSTILMHRQPDNVWRIDYQIADDEDAEAAVKPENVLPRVQSHLDMIGETKPWKPIWISLYNAKCLTLDSYRHGRVLFTGDSGHLVPIFGVRGLNSGLDDVGNAAWKLAWVLKAGANPSLLDSFSMERVHATRQNIAYGAKSTEFMAPPTFAYELMRSAALRLALTDASVRSLINPRQSSPISYDGSILNLADGAAHDGVAAAPGQPAPELKLWRDDKSVHLTEWFGKGFVVLTLGATDAQRHQLQALVEQTQGADVPGLAWVDAAVEPQAAPLYVDAAHVQQRFGATADRVVLLRPDGYVMGRWPLADIGQVAEAVAPFYGKP